MTLMATIGRNAPGRRTRRATGDWIAAAVLVLVLLATLGIFYGDPLVDFDEML